MAAAAGAGAKPVAADAIAGLIADALAAVGLLPADAAKVAELMLEADLTGADAHGVFRLPQYITRIKAGGFNPRANITVTKTAPATAMVDGDNGMGHLVLARAAETAIAQARDCGVAWVGIHRSNHAGAAGVYTALMLPHDMIGIYSAVASANHMAPWGGNEPLLGTNPLAFAIPAGAEPPLVLDIATSIVSYGTIKNYRMQGKPLPEGWLVHSKTGEPVLDAARSAEALLLPLGGYKGSGLAIVLGVLCGVLNGAVFGRDVVDFNADQSSLTDTGQFIVALDIARFIGVDKFRGEMDRHLRDLRASGTLPGFDSIRLPGAERAKRRAERVRDGVPLAPELVAQLDQLAAELGVTPLADRI